MNDNQLSLCAQWWWWIISCYETINWKPSPFLLVEEPGQQKEADPDDYSRISHIKGRPVVAAKIKIEKIHHRAITDPVQKITDRPPADQGKDDEIEPSFLTVLLKGKENEKQGSAGDADKKRYPPGRVGAGKQTEGGPGVMEIGQIEKTGNNGNGLMQHETGHNQPLGVLVRGHHQQGQNNERRKGRRPSLSHRFTR